MKERNTGFLVEEIEIDFGRQGIRKISLLGENAERNRTHFTLVAGANGTSKSRILAKLVEHLTQIWAGESEDRPRPVATRAYGITCRSLKVVANNSVHQFFRDQKEDSSDVEDSSDIADFLPSRILVLSNLVMDKFHFVRGEQFDESFYHYLGVRQASNLTTTGSIERSVSEAILRMMGEPERLADFDAWIDLVFGRLVQIGLGFQRLRLRPFEELLRANAPEKFVRDLLESKGRRVEEADLEKLVTALIEIAKFLVPLLADRAARASKVGTKRVDLLLAHSLDPQARRRLSEIAMFFPAAARAGLSVWPEIYFESDELLPFGQLSSGEQNLLSVGAKLIAHAMPGSLIVIDEPEVSLNVVWQQQYIDLIERSLRHAKRSHVLIATHSPHLIASLPRGEASVVLAKREEQGLQFVTEDATYQGWGSESVLYHVLEIPSTSTFHLNREIAEVLRHVQEGGKNKSLIDSFLQTMSRLNYKGIEPLELVVEEVKRYSETLE